MNKFVAIWTKLRKSLRGIPKIPAIILMGLFAAAVFANVLAPHNPEVGDPRERLLPTFFEEKGTVKYFLGTDTMGRDVFSRLLFGGRVSLLVGILAVLIASVPGTVLGLIAGYYRSWLDALS